MVNVSMWWLLLLGSLWAGVQNALAGGGSFITLPVLMASGLDPRLANLSSTIAMFPGQVMTGWIGRSSASREGAGGLSLPLLLLVSFFGGAVGACLLLLTPEKFFERLLPWLVLLATVIFAWGSLRRPSPQGHFKNPWAMVIAQSLISIYGGYFGGGIGFVMLAALTLAGLSVRSAGATKNVLAAVMNASAVGIFIFTPGISWMRVAVVCCGALIGGYIGVRLLTRVNEKWIRLFIVVVGACLTIGLFLRDT